MNVDGTETIDRNTIAGRFIPVIEAMFQSGARVRGQPLGETKYSLVLPAWVHNICDKFIKTLFRNVMEMAPRDNQFIARQYGQIVGLLLRGVVVYLREFPEILKKHGLEEMLHLTDEQGKKLDEISGMPLIISAASEYLHKPITNEGELFETVEQSVEKRAEDIVAHFFLVLRYLLDRPVQEQYEFLRGIPEGFKAFLNFQSEFTGEKRRVEIYFSLLRYWPEIVEMQKAQPPKTRRDLLDWLEKQEERQLVTDAKLFYELCDEIGLDMAPPGHPFGSKRA